MDFKFESIVTRVKFHVMVGELFISTNNNEVGIGWNGASWSVRIPDLHGELKVFRVSLLTEA
jgi:hypothetical protein